MLIEELYTRRSTLVTFTETSYACFVARGLDDQDFSHSTAGASTWAFLIALMKVNDPEITICT